MIKVYLHAGLPKTGTTAIQDWLTRNAATLREIGVFTFEDSKYAHRLAVVAINDPE